MLKFLNKYRKSPYLQNFAALAGSEVIAQTILVGVTPLLTRFYTPADFGQYEFFKSTALLLVVIAFLNYDVSIYTAKNDKERVNSVLLSVLVLFIICFIASIILFFFNDSFVNAFQSEIKSGWYWTLPVYAFFAAFTNLMLVVLTKDGSFFLMSKIKIAVSILVAASQISFGYLKMGYWGLIYSTIMVQVIAFISYFYPFLRINYMNFRLLDISEMRKIWKENWRLPSIVLPGNFLNNFVQTLPIFFLGKIDINVLGYYSLARRIIDFPLKFVTGAVQRLYINEIIEEVKVTGVGKRSFDKHLKLFSIIALILFLGILVFTKPVLPFLFGKEWTPAIPYIIFLGLFFSIKFIFGGLSFVMILGKAPKIDILWQIFFGVIIFISFTITLKIKLNSFGSLLVFVTCGIFCYFIYGYVCRKVAKDKNLLNIK